MTDANQIVLARRPAGDVTADCFRTETVTLPALADGQVLVSGRLAAAVEDMAEVEHLGEREIRGMARPVAVANLRSVRV